MLLEKRSQTKNNWYGYTELDVIMQKRWQKAPLGVGGSKGIARGKVRQSVY